MVFGEFCIVGRYDSVSISVKSTSMSSSMCSGIGVLGSKTPNAGLSRLRLMIALPDSVFI